MARLTYLLFPLVALFGTIAVAAPLEARDFSGQANFYDQLGATGACGKANSDNDLIAAMNTAQYEGGKVCGEKIKVSSGAKSVTVTIADHCPSCESQSIELSRGAFQKLASFDKRTGIPIKWNYV